MKWKYEQSLSKKHATIDKLKHEFNKMLINFNNIEDATNFREAMDEPSLGMDVLLKYVLKFVWISPVRIDFYFQCSK